MSLRESWNDLGTAGKVLIGVAVGGVVLVVGLVVLLILAAVLGSFVLGMGEQSTATAPQMSMAMDYDSASEVATLTHDGGDAIAASKLLIETDQRTFEWEDQDGEVVAGDSTTVDVASGASVRVLWTGEDETRVLAEFTAP